MLGTDFVERDAVKLEAIYQFGRESFREREAEVRWVRIAERLAAKAGGSA